MNEKDQILIQQSRLCDDWQDSSNLEKQAESDHAKRIIHIRTMTLYHAEEAFAGIL